MSKDELDVGTSLLAKSLLKNDLDILRSIGKDIQYIPNVIKGHEIFPCLY